MDPRTARIRALNDELRHNLAAGVAVMTPGVAALGQEAVDRIVKTIAVFDDFCHANDPYEEHDFGSFEAEGHTIFFVTTQVSLSRALEFGDEPFWVCGEGVEHIPTLFFRR
jgi:Protein of unknown function (DUF3768)